MDPYENYGALLADEEPAYDWRDDLGQEPDIIDMIEVTESLLGCKL